MSSAGRLNAKSESCTIRHRSSVGRMAMRRNGSVGDEARLGRPKLMGFSRDAAACAPLLGEQRQEHLIVVRVTLEPNRLTGHRFLHRAELTERALAASVGYRSAGFESSRAEHVEDEVDHHRRGTEEQAAAPMLVREGKLPFGRAEPGLDLSHSKQPSHGPGVGNHGKPQRAPVATFEHRGLDTRREIGRGFRSRDNGPREVGVNEQREERQCVLVFGFAKGDAASSKNRAERSPRAGIGVSRYQPVLRRTAPRCAIVVHD
jgi:hypothetical protein